MKKLPHFVLASFLLHFFLIVSVWIFPWIDFFSSKAPLMGGGGSIAVEIASRSFHEHESRSRENASRSIHDHEKIFRDRDRETRYERSAPGLGAGPFAAGPGSGADGSNPILAEIRSRIERAKRYPLIAQKSRLEGKSLVRFRIDAEGKPQEILLKSGSGSQILDEESLQTIQRGTPYPVYGEPLEVWIHFKATE